MRNEAKYFILDEEDVIGAIYESPELGRTIIQYNMGKNNLKSIRIMDRDNVIVAEKDFIELILSMLMNN